MKIRHSATRRKEIEQQPSEQEVEVPQAARVSTEPGSSSKATQHSKEKTLPAKRRTRSDKGRSITPEKEEIPQRQLRSSTVKQRAKKVINFMSEIMSERVKNRFFQQSNHLLSILRSNLCPLLCR
jgi:hypothetical protein